MLSFWWKICSNYLNSYFNIFTLTTMSDKQCMHVQTNKNFETYLMYRDIGNASQYSQNQL